MPIGSPDGEITFIMLRSASGFKGKMNEMKRKKVRPASFHSGFRAGPHRDGSIKKNSL